MLPTQFQVKWPFGLGGEANNIFSRWQPSWISNRNNFSYFFIYKSPRRFLPNYKSIGLSVQEKKGKYIFHGRHLGFPNRNDLAIFDLLVNPIFANKCKPSWTFGSGEEAKKRFSRWPRLRPSCISDSNDFS